MLNEQLALLANEEETLRRELEEEETRLRSEIESRRQAILQLRANRLLPNQVDAPAPIRPTLPLSAPAPTSSMNTILHPSQAQQNDAFHMSRSNIRTGNGLDQAYLRIPPTQTTSILPHIVSSSHEQLLISSQLFYLKTLH